LIGIVTDRDICLRMVAAGTDYEIAVEEIMSKSPISCTASDSLTLCESLMEQYRVRRIPVVDSEWRLVGIVAQADIALHDSSEHIARTVAAISQKRTYGKQSDFQLSRHEVLSTR